MPEQETFLDVSFPTNGIDTSHSFSMPLPKTSAQAKNVRTFEAQTQRGRGGIRPGLGKYIAQQLPSGTHKIQNLNVVVDPSAAALLDDPATDPSPDDGTTDPSNLGRGLGRVVRTGGSGRMHNRNRKKRPIINWSNPANISQGTALSGTQLNATATDPTSGLSVSGSFAYNPASGTVLSSGNHQALRTTFTPSDSVTYVTSSKTVYINVTGTSPTFVQSKGNNWNTGNSSLDVTFTSNVTMGNALYAAIMTKHGTDPSYTVSVTDSQGNSYTQIGSYARESGNGTTYLATSLWMAYAGSSGPCIVSTPTPGGVTTLANEIMVILEYSGVKSSGALDGTSTNNVSFPDNTRTTGAVTVSSSNELILGAFGQFSYATYNPDAGFNLRGFRNIGGSGTSGDCVAVLDGTNPSMGSVPVTATLTNVEDPGFEAYAAVGASFKAT